MHVGMYDCLRSESESAPQSSPPPLKGGRVISACARTVCADSCRACSYSGQPKNRYLQKHWSIIKTTMFSAKEKERDKHACMHMQVCIHVPTAAQPHLKGVRVWSVCAATTSLIHPLCLSVCLYMYVRVSWYIHSPCSTNIWCWVNQLSYTLIRTLTPIQHFHASTVSQYSATRNTHTHWRDESSAKTPGDRTDNWLLNKLRFLYRGETES